MSAHRASLSRLIALASLLVAPLVLAQSAPPPPKQGAVCRDDIAALCPGIQPGKGAHRAVAQCLESQLDALSTQCRAHVDAMRARAEAARQACQPDVEKFCAGIAPGAGAIRQCLRQHASELSDACKAVHAGHQGPAPPAAAPTSK
jgi:hypothetical protein